MTDSNNEKKRKKDLREKILGEIKDKGRDFDEIKQKYQNMELSMVVCFILCDKGNDGSRDKDLDNLLKILLDALSDNLNEDQNEKRSSIISDDKSFFHIDCKKKIVKEESQSGIDFKIYRYRK